MISTLCVVFLSTNNWDLPSPSRNNNALGAFSGPRAHVLSRAIISRAQRRLHTMRLVCGARVQI